MGVVALVALKGHHYGHWRKPGERYQASSDHARFLIKLNRAKLAETPAPVPEVVPAPTPEPPKRERYRRRDLQAADTAPVIEPTHSDAEAPAAHTYDTANLKADE